MARLGLPPISRQICWHDERPADSATRPECDYATQPGKRRLCKEAQRKTWVNVRRLSDLDLASCDKSRRSMKVCIVSSEFLGPVKNSGIATVTTALARQLAADGHEVTLLYTYVGYGKPISGDKSWSHWVELLASEGVSLAHIPHEGDYRAWREASWLVKDFISQKNFELVYFNDYFGSGYYPLLSKRAGFSPFCNQLHCVITHGAMEWVFNLNDYYAVRLSDIEWMGLERRSVEMADVVIAPSRYIIGEYRTYGWRLPTQIFCQPYPIYESQSEIRYTRPNTIGELVFFGRLEARKGLWLFCEALDRLARRFPTIDVTFLGRVTDFSGISSALQIVNRTARWPFRVRLISDFDHEQALSYLREPGRLAVMPSLADNSPCAVYECMEAGVPFVTTSGSGAGELVRKDCWDDVMVQPNVKSLAKKLGDILEHGARIARPWFDPAENLATWSAWHRFVAERRHELVKNAIPSVAPSSREDNAAALVLVVDSGACALAVLIDNLSSHVKRFGGRAVYVILSSRRGKIQDALRGIIVAERPTFPFLILDPRGIDEVKRIVAASEFVFIVSAETQIFTSFFVSALEKLRRRERAIVTCIVAVRRMQHENGEIERFPAGDIPGLAAVGEPVGGSVCALSVVKLSDELSALALYDAQLDALSSASSIGQQLMQQCRSKALPVDLLPTVGAVEIRDDELPTRFTGFNDAHRAAASVGIGSSLCNGGPAWFAIASMMPRAGPGEDTRLECAEFLPPSHPFAQIRSPDGQKTDLPELAAALGRTQLSVELEASRPPAPARVRHLREVAERSEQLCPEWNLLDLLIRENVFEFGVTTLPQARERLHSGVDQLPIDPVENEAADLLGRRAAEDGPGRGTGRLPEGAVRFYVDARKLRIKRNTIQAIKDLRSGDPGKIYVVDVPLCGQAMLTVMLRSNNPADSVLTHVRIIDQKQGAEMGASSTRLAGNAPGEISIALHGVYGRATIEFEFSEAQKMDVVVEVFLIK